MCSNIDGVQTGVPAGYTSEGGECLEGNPVVTKYEFCHATEVVGAKNGWLALELPLTAIYAGHSEHSGDIIPVIAPAFPEGQNLGTLYPNYGDGVTGAEILEGGCQDPVITPNLATATLAFSSATCDAPQQLNRDGFAASNAEWGADTDPSELGYTIVAAAATGAEFAEGDGDEGNLATKTRSGELDPMLVGQACDEDVEVATATLAFTPASCLAAQSPNIGGSSKTNATFGADTDLSLLGYSIVATAINGAEFASGAGVASDLKSKTFTGTLNAIFPDSDPRCLNTLGLVMPTVGFSQATCSASGSYTLGVAQGYDPKHVTFTVNDVPNVLPGTYSVVGAQVVTVTAQPVAPNGLEFDWVDPPALRFLATAGCVQLATLPTLPTLAFTGSGSGIGLTLAGGFAFLGIGGFLIYLRRRQVKSD
ncbi:MAG: LPXTG cell wall anchor domain-containing protein [Salinibacterium sp.]|nr:LPXTG cell wall anchor domain-containing protein [Salinibacterium sp.]